MTLAPATDAKQTSVNELRQRGGMNDLSPSDKCKQTKLLTKEDKDGGAQVQDLILGNLTKRAERSATK